MSKATARDGRPATQGAQKLGLAAKAGTSSFVASRVVRGSLPTKGQPSSKSDEPCLAPTLDESEKQFLLEFANTEYRKAYEFAATIGMQDDPDAVSAAGAFTGAGTRAK
jgi:hypothetical protein